MASPLERKTDGTGPRIAAQPTPARRRCPPDPAQRDLAPIGPERLRRLREAIRNGTYPLDENAEQGLLRMLLGDPPRPRDP